MYALLLFVFLTAAAPAWAGTAEVGVYDSRAASGETGYSRIDLSFSYKKFSLTPSVRTGLHSFYSRSAKPINYVGSGEIAYAISDDVELRAGHASFHNVDCSNPGETSQDWVSAHVKLSTPPLTVESVARLYVNTNARASINDIEFEFPAPSAEVAAQIFYEAPLDISIYAGGGITWLKLGAVKLRSIRHPLVIPSPTWFYSYRVGLARRLFGPVSARLELFEDRSLFDSPFYTTAKRGVALSIIGEF